MRDSLKETTRNELNEGFTLIELLVVVAIISLLAAILFPVFARARENARRSSCMSNLKQLSLSTMMYVQDYDETYPRSQQSNDDHYGSYTYWIKLLQPYTQSTQLFFCPSSTTNYDNTMYGGYGANQNIFVRRQFSTPPVKMAAIPAVAKTYMMMDFGQYNFTESLVGSPNNAGYLPGIGAVKHLTAADCPDNPDSSYDKYRNDCMSGRHFGGVNMAFADGHVKWLKSETVYAETLKPGGGAIGLNDD